MGVDNLICTSAQKRGTLRSNVFHCSHEVRSSLSHNSFVHSQHNSFLLLVFVGGAVASWLVCLTPERAVRVRALAGDIVLCSWARHSTPTVPPSTQVYKWVPANLMLGVTLRWTSIPSRGSRNTLSRFMLRKPG